MPNHTEFDFESAIEADLTECGGYETRAPSDFNEELALFPEDVCGFLKDSQTVTWVALERLLGPSTSETVLTSLTKELELKGTLHILRHGFKCYGKMLRMAFFRPNTTMNADAAKNFATNRLTITRQVKFTSKAKKADGSSRRCIIDVTLAVNGIPVVTAELKNPLTGQRASDAISQYKSERDGQDLLLKFSKRTLVHFAVDPDEVWMTTRLNGRETNFLPFNRGYNRGGGNPPVQGNWKSHYLWDEVLKADSLLEILQRFMHMEVKEFPAGSGQSVRTFRKEKMIFPRYHQLIAVRNLVAHAKANGSGRNYLVQHSAGSGKSITIAWLSYQLASLHSENDEKQFHSVIVVTDRRLLDQQLQKTIYQFEHQAGVVEKIDQNTQQLAEALSKGTPIIITTLQKFPFISQALSTLDKKGVDVNIDTAGKRFAVIVDEAHSSQSGENAAALRGMLNKAGIEAAIATQLSDEEDEDLSEEVRTAVLRDALKRARQPNLSFFAFTATPKFRTKVLFDEPGPSGESPFHEYTLRQAIEEGYVMDVLQNYTTYKRFYGLIKTVEDDPRVPRRKAVKALIRYSELHPANIEQVVSVIVEHFRLRAMKEFLGQGKAMVVTDSRIAAVKYKLAFDKYIRDNDYADIRSLVAFSGTVEDPSNPGSTYTEVQMNEGLAESELPEAFGRDEYRVLLVAEKYQTGFDQPLLQAMYVVKRLAGIQAVQTLSRLNRVAPGKSCTFILDFVNDETKIYKAFKPYYETTQVGRNADPHRLSELQHRLEESAVFTPKDVTDFSSVWYKKEQYHSANDHRVLNSILDIVVRRFMDQVEQRREEFRRQLKAYRNLYAFLSQIIPYQDSELERLYTFVRNLLAKLPPRGDGRLFELDDEVALKFFRLQQIKEGSIDLSNGPADPLKGPTDVGRKQRKDEKEALSRVVGRVNDQLGTEFTESDRLFLDQIVASVKDDGQTAKRVAEAASANNYEDFSAFLELALDSLFMARMKGNDEIFSRVMTDSDFRSAAHDYLAYHIYNRFRDKRTFA